MALTVSVVDQNGDPVGGATIEAVWDDGETTTTTASNGKVFIDVPEGADIELDIDDDRYVRNQPLLVQNANEREVEVRVFPQGNAAILFRGEDPVVYGGRESDNTDTIYVWQR